MKQWNSIGGTVERSWWNSVVEKWKSVVNSKTVMVEQCGGTVEQSWWNSKVEQCGGTVEQSWWDSVAEQWNSDGETVEK